MKSPPETSSPDDKELKDRALTLISGQNTMTLATAQGDAPWAAPVYYASLQFIFYFFSDPKSRHISEAVDSHQVSAAIFEPASTWKEIRGVQMTGRIQSLSPGLEALRALRAYLKKFPFTKDFFEDGQPLNLGAFSKTFRVKFYRFKPHLLYYTDNSINFSFRAEIPLNH